MCEETPDAKSMRDIRVNYMSDIIHVSDKVQFKRKVWF